MIPSGLSRGPSIETFLSQNAHFETKYFRELASEHLMKFKKEIDGYFPSLGENDFVYIRNPFTENVQMLQAGTGTQEKLVELQYDGFTCDVYSIVT